MIKRAVTYLRRNSAPRLFINILGGVSLGHGAARLYLTSGQAGGPFLAAGILLLLVAFSPFILYRRSGS